MIYSREKFCWNKKKKSCIVIEKKKRRGLIDRQLSITLWATTHWYLYIYWAYTHWGVKSLQGPISTTWSHETVCISVKKVIKFEKCPLWMSPWKHERAHDERETESKRKKKKKRERVTWQNLKPAKFPWVSYFVIVNGNMTNEMTFQRLNY